MLTRNEVCKEIKQALKRRSGKVWSVTGGTGTAYGWITIRSPKARQSDNYGGLCDADREELRLLLGLERIHGSVSIPAGSDFYREYIDRANGRVPSQYGTRYWD